MSVERLQDPSPVRIKLRFPTGWCKKTAQAFCSLDDFWDLLSTTCVRYTTKEWLTKETRAPSRDHSLQERLHAIRKNAIGQGRTNHPDVSKNPHTLLANLIRVHALGALITAHRICQRISTYHYCICCTERAFPERTVGGGITPTPTRTRPFMHTSAKSGSASARCAYGPPGKTNDGSGVLYTRSRLPMRPSVSSGTTRRKSAMQGGPKNGVFPTRIVIDQRGP